MAKISGSSDRHIATLRKRACAPCTVVKAMCDFARPTCSRSIKQFQDEDAVTEPRGSRARRQTSGHYTLPGPGPVSAQSSAPILASPDLASVSAEGVSMYQHPHAIDQKALFGSVDGGVLTPLGISHIRNRWLEFYFIFAMKQTKEYSPPHYIIDIKNAVFISSGLDPQPVAYATIYTPYTISEPT